MGSCVGASRTEILAAALADRVFEALSMLVASMPIVVMDGLFQRRERIEPEPMSETPSSSPDSSRKRFSS
jgi:hypothetical protein